MAIFITSITEHPYIKLLSRSPYWIGQDIPIPADEVYDVGRDDDTAALIIDYEKRLAKDGNDFDTLLNLGKLYTRTSMGQKRFSLLKKAHRQQPDHPEVLKYLAISHVDAHYQYRNALDLMNRYVSEEPDDLFGHLFHGYLFLVLDEPKQAIRSFVRGLELDPGNIYGLSKLAHAYQKTGGKEDLEQAEVIHERLQKTALDNVRTGWLEAQLR